MKSFGYTGWVEDKYEKRDKNEEKKSCHRRQKVHNVSVVLVEEQFAHLELDIGLIWVDQPLGNIV